MNNPNFYMVWNPDRQEPRIQHNSLDAAKAEAKRLAHSHPGEIFIVLVSVGEFVVNDPAIWTKHDDLPYRHERRSLRHKVNRPTWPNS